MALTDIFKSTREIKAEERRVRRRNEREVERGIRKFDDVIRKYEKQREEIWAKALSYMSVGKESDAAKLVQQHKLLGVQVDRLAKQRLLMQTKMTDVATAGSVGSIIGQIKEFAESQHVDPDKLAEDLDEIQNVAMDADEINTVVDEALRQDMEKAAVEAEKSGVSNIDEEMRTLRKEAADRVSGMPTPGATVKEDPALNINAGIKEVEAKLAKLSGKE